MGSIWTIPLNEPFLDGLVGGLLQEPPERLAATTLLLPSRRACLAARDTFLRLVEGRPRGGSPAPRSWSRRAPAAGG